MRKMILLAIVLTLGGCATQAQRAEIANRNTAENSALQSSLENTSVTCETKKTCDKAFSFAKIFIQENADMKIQSSDDTIVSTFAPIKYGRIAMEAKKIPGQGESSEISLNVYCKGLSMADSGPVSSTCKRRVAAVNNLFKPYIESRMH